MSESEVNQSVPPSTNGPNSLENQLETLRAIFANHETNPPLGWEWVHTFEETHQVILPEPYRTFVAEIASGCPTGPPEYGLQPLQMQQKEGLRLPFPLTELWIWEGETENPEYAELHDQAWNCGSIELGTDGCGMYWHLIVTGEHRGQIWQLAEVGALPYGKPFGGSTGEPGFTGWVVHWSEGEEWFL